MEFTRRTCPNQESAWRLPRVAVMKIAAISIADYSEGTEGMPHDVERLYFRFILKMFSREGGIPDDDADNARIFGYRDVRTYKSLKAKLLAWQNALYVEDGLLKNERVENDLSAYREKKRLAADHGRIGGRSRRDRAEIDPRSSADVETIPHTTDRENNDLDKASPSPSPSPKENNPLTPFADPYDRCSFEDGEIVLRNGLRAYWLDRFGGDEIRLDLALKQAAGYVQENSRKPLEAQVGAQLGRIAGEKHDRDQRYAAAAKKPDRPTSSSIKIKPRPLPRDEAAEEAVMQARAKAIVDAACAGVRQ